MTEPGEEISADVAALLEAARSGIPAAALPTAAALAAARREKEEKLKNGTPGELVHGEGVYLGLFRIIDNTATSLKTFAVFAARQDLKSDSGRGCFTYNEATARVAQVRDLEGHDGESYADHEDFFMALRRGHYNGGWVIPPYEIVTGQDVAGRDVMAGNLRACQDSGVLKNTFCKAASPGSWDSAAWYWTCTAGGTGSMRNVNFKSSGTALSDKETRSLACRLVRFVEVKP